MTDAFEALAKTVARAKGMPDLSIVVIRGHVGGITAEEVFKKVDAIQKTVNDLVTTSKVKDKVENFAGAGPIIKTVEINVRDDDYFTPLYELNWTDGLPVIPPTKNRVETMLKGTRHSPDEVVAILPPKGGKATVEKIAANAVMAGCLPEYLPVILACVEAIGDPDCNMAGWASTTGPNSPMFIINGPVKDEIGLNYETNALGTGRRANATIGRALSLIIKNIGGVIPGVTDMTTIGSPWEYSMCLAENEGKLPHGWPPLNEERGFSGANTVTAKCINSQIDVFAHNALKLQQVLDTIAAGIVGINSLAILQGQGVLIALCPEVAALAEKDRWTKAKVKQYIFEKARQPLSAWKYLGDNWVARELIPESMYESDDSLIRMIPDTEDILIIVAGGPGKHCQWWAGGHGRAVTKSIDSWK